MTRSLLWPVAALALLGAAAPQQEPEDSFPNDVPDNMQDFREDMLGDNTPEETRDAQTARGPGIGGSGGDALTGTVVSRDADRLVVRQGSRILSLEVTEQTQLPGGRDPLREGDQVRAAFTVGADGGLVATEVERLPRAAAERPGKEEAPARGDQR